MAASPDRLVAGLVGNRYEIDGLIASGGMGSVYRARDTVLDRIVALKVLRDDDPGFVGRFKTEATNAARLSHPNIVAVFDFGVPEGSPYMAMEYVDGQTLREVLHARGVLRSELAASIAAQVAAALEHARRAGLVHRDVKPENILVTTEGRVKVTDFGLSQALAASHATRPGTLVGTAHYLAPEQVSHGEADHRSDVYALGVVLYEMLTGRPPFGGDSPVAIATRRVEQDVPRPGAINPSVPAELDAIVARAAARDPEERFPTAGAMAEALRAALPRADTDEVGALVHHTTAIPLDTEATVAIASPGARRRERARATRRRRLAIVATLVAALVGGSTLAVVQLRTHPVPELVGLTQERARALVESAGFRADVVLRNDPVVPAGNVISQRPAAEAGLRKGEPVEIVVSLGPELASLPDVREELFADAERALRDKGFENIVRLDVFHPSAPKLTVVGQDPEPGLLIATDAKVTLRVSKGPEFVKLPDVVGDPRETATADLRTAGFEVVIREVETLSAPEGRVLKQTPAAGARVAKGAKVTLLVAKSPPLAPVPDLRCMTQRQAADRLGADGFAARFSGSGRRVVDQSPGPGDRAPQGSTVTVYLGVGTYC